MRKEMSEAQWTSKGERRNVKLQAKGKECNAPWKGVQDSGDCPGVGLLSYNGMKFKICHLITKVLLLKIANDDAFPSLKWCNSIFQHPRFIKSWGFNWTMRALLPRQKPRKYNFMTEIIWERKIDGLYGKILSLLQNWSAHFTNVIRLT